MASFPTSVFSPSARSNGQVIDASHVNDLQGEVTAIEDGFRNATAPLNSSRSTLASLSVTGNSTVAALNAGNSTLANLSVTGGSTFGAMTLGASTLASLSVSGASTFAVIPVIPRMPYCAVRMSADLNLTNGSDVGINWDVENADADGLHSTTSNSSIVTLTSSGVWLISVQTKWRIPDTAGYFYTRIRADGSVIATNDRTANANSTQMVHQATALYLATSTTVAVTVTATQGSGSTRSLGGSTDFGGTVLSVLRMSF